MKRRDLFICTLSLAVALPAFIMGRALVVLIDACTNLFYRGTLSTAPGAPDPGHWGVLSLFVPALGGLLVGVMARYGSKAIRGHGIPEAMEQVLINESRISAKVAWLKPLSSAIAIGSGGPFGAEGPIIATGAALGSLLGQHISLDGRERKLLLASGAAAGMASIFGTPLAAVLLALELLLFEFSPTAILAVGLAATAAAGLRAAWVSSAPVFAMPDVAFPGGGALCLYAAMGIPLGFVAVMVSKSLYWIEERFEKLPLHWMFWPALAGLAVGAIGLVEPRTLGVGYSNITETLAGHCVGLALLLLITLKFLSWSLALGSGTSGGTLAPLLTLGSGLGYLCTTLLAALMPQLGLDPRIGALVGMAALFSGCSGAPMASLVFALEATHQIPGLLPLLAASLVAAAVARAMHPYTIMTERLGRRGLKVPHSWGAPIH
jgi:CIC family chloride channel protein